jgi:uncharacterized protein YaeQ
MASGATVFRFEIELSDVDRGVYEALDLRVARHPSETMRYLLTRVLAYCLCHEEGIAFSKGGLSDTDEPALSIRDLQGNLRASIEVGSPSADRLHKASKAAPRLVVFTYGDPAQLLRVAAERAIYKVGRIEVVAVPPAFLDELAAVTERSTRWQLACTDGQIYVTAGERSVCGAITLHRLS